MPTSRTFGVRHDVRMARRGRRGEGSVYFSKVDRRWVARWPMGVDAKTGRRRAKRATARTQGEAEAKLERLRRLYGRRGNPATEPLDRYLENWLERHAENVAKSTIASYRYHVDHWIDPLLGGIPVIELEPSDVLRLVDEMRRKRKSPGYVHLVVRTLSVALQAALDERRIGDNAARGVKLPPIRRKAVEALTEDRAEQILEAVTGSWIELPIRVLMGSGMRRGELVGLDQGDLLLDAGYVRIRKSKTGERATPISDDAVAALRLALERAPRNGPKEPVFFSPRVNRAGHRDRLAPDSLSHALPRLLERAGLGHLAPHALRHGAATRMLTAGASMRVIAEQLGHRNPALTSRLYAHVVPESQRAAVAHLDRRRAR